MSLADKCTDWINKKSPWGSYFSVADNGNISPQNNYKIEVSSKNDLVTVIPTAKKQSDFPSRVFIQRNPQNVTQIYRIEELFPNGEKQVIKFSNNESGCTPDERYSIDKNGAYYKMKWNLNLCEEVRNYFKNNEAQIQSCKSTNRELTDILKKYVPENDFKTEAKGASGLIMAAGFNKLCDDIEIFLPTTKGANKQPTTSK